MQRPFKHTFLNTSVCSTIPTTANVGQHQLYSRMTFKSNYQYKYDCHFKPYVSFELCSRIYRLLLFIKLRFQVFQFIPIIKSIIWKYCKILNRIRHCLSWWYFYFLVILISDGLYVFLICWTYTYNMFVFGIPLLLNLTLDCHKDKNQVWWSQLKWEGSHNIFFGL